MKNSLTSFNNEFSSSSSSKINALLDELNILYNKQNIENKDENIKCIIFSQWTSMLDLLESPLKKMGLKYCRLDGTMAQNNREFQVKKFNTDDNVKVFLVSMKAGGLGLNLVAASHVFLLDPWWNPATEEQAIDRVHRIGQTKPVVVTRFIIKNTIEERILELQEKKENVITRCTWNEEEWIKTNSNRWIEVII